jgi:hypothetical protein
MKSRRQLSASAEVNGKLISAAYENLGERFRVIALEMKSLNALLTEACDRADQINFPGDLVKRVRQYKEAGDEVTFAMVEGAILLGKLNQAVLYAANKKS